MASKNCQHIKHSSWLLFAVVHIGNRNVGMSVDMNIKRNTVWGKQKRERCHKIEIFLVNINVRV